MRFFNTKTFLCLVVTAAAAGCAEPDSWQPSPAELESQTHEIELAEAMECEAFPEEREAPREEEGRRGEEEVSQLRSSACGGLQNDLCRYTGGCASQLTQVAGTQPVAEALLNACWVEDSPSNCWLSGPAQTLTIHVNISNCGTTWQDMNTLLDQMRLQAEAAVPSGNAITNYNLNGGYMQSAYGPYVLSIQVTHRRQDCLAIAAPVDHQYLPEPNATINH